MLEYITQICIQSLFVFRFVVLRIWLVSLSQLNVYRLERYLMMLTGKSQIVTFCTVLSLSFLNGENKEKANIIAI